MTTPQNCLLEVGSCGCGPLACPLSAVGSQGMAWPRTPWLPSRGLIDLRQEVKHRDGHSPLTLAQPQLPVAAVQEWVLLLSFGGDPEE